MDKKWVMDEDDDDEERVDGCGGMDMVNNIFEGSILCSHSRVFEVE